MSVDARGRGDGNRGMRIGDFMHGCHTRTGSEYVMEAGMHARSRLTALLLVVFNSSLTDQSYVKVHLVGRRKSLSAGHQECDAQALYNFVYYYGKKSISTTIWIWTNRDMKRMTLSKTLKLLS